MYGFNENIKSYQLSKVKTEIILLYFINTQYNMTKITVQEIKIKSVDDDIQSSSALDLQVDHLDSIDPIIFAPVGDIYSFFHVSYKI